MNDRQPLHELEALVHTWRQPLYKFARLHLQPDEEAEDAVQDTLLALLTVDPAALREQDPRHYVFGILKHKVTDRLRRKYRAEVSHEEAFEDGLDETLFDDSGHWVEGVAPAVWRRPDEQMQRDQFFEVVDLCIGKLPRKPARVFSMKNLLDCEPAEICACLGLTQSDYWQCLSRARKQIQLCLTQNWVEGCPQ
jgi:RNA polymerase sigma-70 factor (ECF subfamily)